MSETLIETWFNVRTATGGVRGCADVRDGDIISAVSDTTRSRREIPPPSYFANSCSMAPLTLCSPIVRSGTRGVLFYRTGRSSVSTYMMSDSPRPRVLWPFALHVVRQEDAASCELH